MSYGKGVHLETYHTTGHRVGDCWYPATIPDAGTRTIKVNGLAVILEGDPIVRHCCGDPCHVGYYMGSRNVKFEGRSVQLVGDPISCGDHVAEGSSDVRVGG